MAIRVRRGTDSQRLAVVLEEGEIAYTTDTKKFYVGDGVTLGGTEIGPSSGYVPTTRTLTINGTSYDLSANRTWSVGTVTSVSGTGTVSGLTLSGSVSSSGSLTLGGALTLTSLQVTSALGFTPYSAANPSGYLSSITGLNISSLTNDSGYITSSALSGYLTSATAASTYYPLTNPSGYISGITSGDVTTALGYTPVNKGGDTMTGALILNADPTIALGAATKQYVDNIAAGINFHSPVHAATTGNLSATYLNGVGGVGATLTATSNGALIVDGHTMLAGERVLVWQQSAGLENGIYDVTDTGSVSTPFILTRSTDADNSPAGEIAYGDFTLVIQGTLYGGYGFICNTPGTITIGVTSISYIQYNVAQAVSAGYGLQELTPNVLSVDSSVIATVASLSSYLTTASAAATYQPIGSYLTTISGLNISLLTNDSGYITSSALTGYLTSASAASTYYPLTNPSGYISGITSGDVTTALGFTPYDSTNPAGYITSSALTGYLTTASAASTYFPIPTGTTAQYLRGDGSLATFPTIPTVTPSALTKVDDTNVTLTLGGTPSTALLQSVSLTLGWTGTLADSRIASAATWNAKQNALTNPVTGTGTNNEIAAFNSTGSTITSLTTATYPSLTELSYVKGVTSAVQTQIASRVADTGDTMTGALQFSGTSHAGVVLNNLTTAQRTALAASAGMAVLDTTVGSMAFYTGAYWAYEQYKVASLTTTTLATAANITGLAHDVEANSTYAVEGYYVISCSGTGGVKFTQTTPASSIMDFTYDGISGTAATSLKIRSSASGTLTTTAHNTAIITSGVIIRGFLRTGASAGTLQFQFASGTATQTSTVSLYSWTKIRKIA